jgi:hypothetical protein
MGQVWGGYFVTDGLREAVAEGDQEQASALAN